MFTASRHGQETTIIRSYLRTIGRERDAIADSAGYDGEAETGGYLFDLQPFVDPLLAS